ncbi:MAG: CAP domain-containing protein, partial [Armatimonadota bacterium]
MRVSLPIVGISFCAAPTISQPSAPSHPIPGLRFTAKGEAVVPMVFPVLGNCRWSDTYGAPRGGGTRKHQGQDLPAPKMRPLLACFDGVWTGGGIRGDNGCYATYMHINNDTPGTDDGRGGEEFASPPGIWPGTHVKAGQHVAYCGDSGNAEDTISHLHFELSIPGAGENPAASLRAATHLKAARYSMPVREIAPTAGELRLDGQVVQVDAARGAVQIRVAAWANAKGKVTPQTSPLRRWLRLTEIALSSHATGETLLPGLREIGTGDFVTLLGKDPGKGTISARAVTLLRPSYRMSGWRPAITGSATEPVAGRSGNTPVSPSLISLRTEKVTSLTNTERIRDGVTPLVADPALTAAAQQHAEDMAAQGYFSHTDRQGEGPAERAAANGYPRNVGTGENIASGQATPEAVVQGWMNSPGHRRNILNGDYRTIGVGSATGPGGDSFWVQVFGTVAARGVRTNQIADTPTAGFNFERNGFRGWEMSGDCWEPGPTNRGYGDGRFTGVEGSFYLTTARPRRAGGDAGRTSEVVR